MPKKKRGWLIVEFILRNFYFFRLSSVLFSHFFLYFVLFFHFCWYCLVDENVFIAIAYLSPSFSLFSNMERLRRYFHALPESYIYHLYVPKTNCIQPFNLFSLLYFIHSVCDPDICYIPFLCYSNTSKSMVNYFPKDFLFSSTRKVSYCKFFHLYILE